MGICCSNDKNNARKKEIKTENQYHSIDELKKIEECICKIEILTENCKKTGTGFFLKISIKNVIGNFLVTNEHVITQSMIEAGESITVICGDNKTFYIELLKSKRSIYSFNQDNEGDITLVEILNSDEIKQFLEVDSDSYKNNPESYVKKNIYVFQHPNGGQAKIAAGNVIKIEKNNYEFIHNASTCEGSSGSPIVLSSNLQVIGVHTSGEEIGKNVKNYGTLLSFIILKIQNDFQTKKIFDKPKIQQLKLQGSLIDPLQSKGYLDEPKTKQILQESINNPNIENDMNEENKIHQKVSLNPNNNAILRNKYKNYFELKYDRKFPSKCKIINDDEFQKRFWIFNKNYNQLNDSNCIMFKNNEKTEFSKVFGVCENQMNEIKIIMKKGNILTDIKEMLSECNSLISADFQNFDFSKLNDMSRLFCRCSGILSLNLSNLDISNVTNMEEIFLGCSNLKELNLCNLNASNVTNINNMFSGCSNLSKLNLENLDFSKVKSMENMFNGCSKLSELNLTNFNTSNVTDMSCMFSNCSNLSKLNLTNFNTSNVTNMSYMFF